jgi:Ni,Fe-hydrogenase I large subunit
MTQKKVIIDPVTRIEGHLKIETVIDNSTVVAAKASADMFRGIEKALIGYDARVAQQVTQRVCGVCPYAHAEAASMALENIMGIKPNPNGQLLRNLIIASYQLQDHLLHFYHLCALDFVDITAVLKYQGKDATLSYLKNWVTSELKSKSVFPAAPFLPRYKGDYSQNDELNFSAIKNYAEALPVMAKLHKMVALFGGKAPHPVAIEAGGVTTLPTISNLTKFRTLLTQVEGFITNNYVTDVLAVAGEFKHYFKEGKGHGNLLSYPCFPDADGRRFTFAGGTTINGQFDYFDINGIYEDPSYSYYQSDGSTRSKPLTTTHLAPIPWEEFKQEKSRRDGKYTWSKAPRYKGHAMEVGPVARLINTYRSGTNPELSHLVDKTNHAFGLSIGDYHSVMGRHLSRMLISQIVIKKLKRDLDDIIPGKTAFIEKEIPRNATGFGLTEASRGALGHWIKTDEKGYISNYEMIVPTTWNISPKDSIGKPGALENMLIGTKIADQENPLELARIIRSVDPCIACSVH